MKQRLCYIICLLLLHTSSFALTVSPSNDAFAYQGRIDHSKPSPVIVWQGSEIQTQFSGQTLKLGFSDLEGQVFFNVDVDGESLIIKASNGWQTIPRKFTSGVHSLRLFKRSEASAGWVTFEGIQVDDNAKLTKPQQSSKTNTFIFYGDSITVGACNEDGDNDQWEDRSTHNTALSYATLVANAFNANYRNIAISGMGISKGYQNYTAKEVWNRFYPDPTSQIAPLHSYQPNILFVNFGENDDSFTKNKAQDFPVDFEKNYIQLVETFRKHYPNSQIVLLRGGMYGGAKSLRLIEPWKKVVAALEAKDKNIHHYVFEHWYAQHPRVKNHRIMADELTAWLKKQSWFQ